MKQFIVVTVKLYHGCTEPENVSIGYYDTDSMISARRSAVLTTIENMEKWYALFKENEREDLDVEEIIESIDNPLDTIEHIIGNDELFTSTSWDSTCSCDGCFLSLHIFPLSLPNIPNIPIHVDLTKQKHIDFVYDYIRSLIRYIRTTTAIHYVPSNIKPPNTSHRSVQYIGKLISKLAALTDKQIGVQNRMKIRLYRKLLNPLVIAVRHREDLIQLRTAHSDVTTKYGKLVSSMNRKATVGIDLGLPEIKRDILMYIERYGMPEEFIFETDRLRDIRRELNSSASVVPRSG